MVALWLFAAVTIPLALAVLVFMYLHFVRNPLPFPDWGNAIFVCPDTAAREALFAVLEQHGVTPDRRALSDFADRALFLRRFRFIVNVTEPASWDRLGKPGAGLAIVVPNPVVAAQLARNSLMLAGYSSELFIDPDRDVPPGALAIVTSDALPHWVLVFRKHLTRMGPPPPAWNDNS